MKETAQTAAETLVGEHLSATKALATAYWDGLHHSWGMHFSWALPQQPQGVLTQVVVNVEGSRVVSFWHQTGFECSGGAMFVLLQNDALRWFLSDLAIAMGVSGDWSFRWPEHYPRYAIFSTA